MSYTLHHHLQRAVVFLTLLLPCTKAATLGFTFDGDVANAVFTIDEVEQTTGVTTSLVGFDSSSATVNTITFVVTGHDFDGDALNDSGTFIFNVSSAASTTSGTTVDSGSGRIGVDSPGENGNATRQINGMNTETLDFTYDNLNSSISLSRTGFTAEPTLFTQIQVGGNGDSTLLGGALVGGSTSIDSGLQTFDTPITSFGVEGNSTGNRNNDFGDIEASIQIIPEISSSILCIQGAILLLTHRRRSKKNCTTIQQPNT